MRVCFIEDTDLRGGSQIWVSEATRKFIAAGVDVTLLTSESGWVAEDGAQSGARVVTYDYQGVISEDAANREIWADALRNSDVAVCTVHPSRDGFHCSVFAGTVIAEFGLSTILIPKTGTIVPEYERRFYVPDESLRSTVISITNFTREYLIDHYGIPAAMIELAYQGTEVDLFTRDETRCADAAKRYPLPENAGPILGSVGSFEERKGQVKLLEAVQEVRDRLPNVHAMLVGDGPDREMLQEKVKSMELSDHVTFFPFTSEPVYVFEVIDILVLASLYKEGLPNVLLEAMSMELPVVSSKLAGIPEIIRDGETGYMVEPGNVSELADTIARCWSNPDEYKRMAANARELVATGHNKNQQFGKFMECFERILSSG